MSTQGNEAPAQKMALVWIATLALVVLSIAACIRWADYPTADYFFGGHHHGWIGKFLDGRSLVAYETVIIGALVIVRLARGRLPHFGKIVLIASAASVITYAVNGLLLKPFFGRLPPGDFNFSLNPAVFNYLQGSDASSFPSGHMALSGSFLAVLYRVYPRLRLPIMICVLVGCALLVSGDWHYISDVIAGTFIGVTVGLLAGELWIRHSGERH
jgi:membrane-associated phospholipid phosphatase